jgi:hypothetical protein
MAESDEICCGSCGYPAHATKASACGWCRHTSARIEELEAKLAKERKNGMQDALNLIALLPYGRNEDVSEGQEDAYRAIETALKTNPKMRSM